MSESELHDTAPPPLTLPASELAVAGFWRRACAFALDSVLLAAIGMVLGAFFYAPLAALGPVAQFIGLAIALVYFGIQNSRLCGGQSLGKRALGIRVVDDGGLAISPGRSFVRAFLLCVILVDIASFKFVGSGVGMQILTSIMGLWILALGYFFVFNRVNRRSVHDFLARTCVIRKGEGELRLRPVSRAVVIGFAAVAVLVMGGAIALTLAFRTGSVMGLDMAQIQRAQKALLEDEHVHTAGVTYLYTWSTGQEEKSSTYAAAVWWSETTVDYAAEAANIAQVLIRNVGEADGGLDEPDYIHVSISTGYDIGIASAFRHQDFTKSPDEWTAGTSSASAN